MTIENAGLLAWCDSIRVSMAKDPGRELFANQIQQHGFDFLDNYIEDVLARQPTDSVYDLMKTPGKKKNAPKRTGVAVSAAMKLKSINSTIFEVVEEEKENPTPVNDFHNALLDARHGETTEPKDDHEEQVHVKKAKPEAVNIVNSPSPPALAVDEDDPMNARVAPDRTATKSMEEDSRAPVFNGPVPQDLVEYSHKPPLEDSPSVPLESAPEPAVRGASADATAEEMAPKELSMIAEDDEPNEQSDVRPHASASPARSPPPAIHDMDQDITVPLRDSSGSGSLKRKQSVSQFSGLPAPSPLRKSMRMSREPSVGAGLLAPSLVQTPGAGLGGKRTSWLTKAKEAKALELTGQRRHATFSEGSATNMAGLGLGLRKPEVRPSSRDIFDAVPPARSNTDVGGDQDVDMKVDLHADSSILPVKKKPSPSLDDDFTGTVDSAHVQQQHGTWPSRRAPSEVPHTRHDISEDTTVPLSEEDAEAGALSRLKRALEGAGTRSFRSLGKSLGGNAAAALAEARAAAEARVAQRNTVPGEDVSVVEVERTALASTDTAAPRDAEARSPDSVGGERPAEAVTAAPEVDKRLSISDLVGTGSEKRVEQTATAGTAHPSHGSQEVDMSISTTPPNSPPVVPQKPSVPVFKPVLQPLEHLTAKGSDEPNVLSSTEIPPFVFKLPSADLPATNAFMVKPAAHEPTSSKALFAGSSEVNVPLDDVFDQAVGPKGWMPSAQDTDDTEYSTAPMQPRQDDLEDDDSWHMDEKFRANETWTPYGFVNNDKTDNTWSTLPSRSTSQHGDTESIPPPTHGFAHALHKAAQGSNENYVVHREDDDDALDFDTNFDNAQLGITSEDLRDLEDVDMDLDDSTDQVDLDDMIAAGKATISLVQQKPSEPPRPQSQTSLNSISTSSSQSNVGFLGQASRFMSSVLGNGKPKAKNEPVKSIIRAAAIAKKQQEEADKKASRLKEMENRRQQAMQRKAEEEKARVEEEQKRIKEENEKRKREREEHTGKLPVLKVLKKTEDDTMSKRKLAESQKKLDQKKPPSKDAQTSRTMKPPAPTNLPGTNSKPTGPSKSVLSKQASSSSLATSAAVKDVSASKNNPPSSALKASATKGKAKATHKEDAQPSELLQGQMAARAKAQTQAVQTPRPPPPVASESIELPDINSEYSDSDDEDRPKSFNPPGWAQSPELRQQLEDQSRYNPDDIFGRIGPLRMEEIFRTRQSRFRARTSSANWAGPDELTEYEEREYARRMGYTNRP